MGNSLVVLRNEEIFTSSLVVAEGTGNEHRSIVALLNRYRGDFEEFGKICFRDLKSRNKSDDLRGRPTRVYFLDECQATLLVTYLDNTPVVRAFKKELVRQFYVMRRLLLERQTQVWADTRALGKLSRRAETDVIQELVEYARAQGSQHPDRLYLVYSKLANQMAGVTDREAASVAQLNQLDVVETIISRSIEAGMREGKHYRTIYQDCKQWLVAYQAVVFLGPAADSKLSALPA